MEEFEPKVGDFYMIVRIDNSYMNPNGLMNKFIGNVYKVSEVCVDNKGYYLNFEEGIADSDKIFSLNSWFWRPGKNCVPFKKKLLKLKLKF